MSTKTTAAGLPGSPQAPINSSGAPHVDLGKKQEQNIAVTAPLFTDGVDPSHAAHLAKLPELPEHVSKKPGTGRQLPYLPALEFASTVREATKEGRIENLGGGICGAQLLRTSVGEPLAVLKPPLTVCHRAAITPGNEHHREAAASRLAIAVSRMTGEPAFSACVPTTVLLKDQNKSAQAFVPNAITLQDAFIGNGDPETALAKAMSPAAYEQTMVIAMLTANLDGRPANILLTGRDKDGQDIPAKDLAKRLGEPGVVVVPHLIDNGLSFPEGTPQELVASLAYIPHGHKPWSADTLAHIRKLDADVLVATLGPELEAAKGPLRERIAILKAAADFDPPPTTHEVMGRIAYVHDGFGSALDPKEQGVERSFFAAKGSTNAGEYPQTSENWT